MLDNSNSEVRDCIVKLLDDHGVEHSVKVRAASVYEAALRGLERLEKVGWESNGSQIGTVVVEVYEEPTLGSGLHLIPNEGIPRVRHVRLLR